MIPSCATIRVFILFLQILTVLTVAPDDLYAIQIAPNPNPDGNTIIISPSVPVENLVPFSNVGTINIQPSASLSNASRFDNIGGISNAGAFSVAATGQYIQELTPGGSLTPAMSNSGTVTNAGTVRIGEGTSFGSFSNRIPPVAQYIQQAGGTTHIEGTFQIGGAHVENAGAITIGTTGTYLQAFNKFAPVLSTTLNTGTFTNAGSALVSAGTFTNQGSVVNSGTVQIAVNGAGTLANDGTMVNAGTFEVGRLGQVTGTGSYAQTTAVSQTIVNGTFVHNLSLQAGTLSGAGTITGTVTNTGGVVQPGTAVQPGVLTLANYVQGPAGRLDLKLGGLLAGSQYDVLKVTGSGVFGGSLSLRLINNFTPGLGYRFDLLTCSLGCTGAHGGSLFSGGVGLPSLSSGLSWSSELTNGGTAFSYTIVASAASAPEPGTLLLVGSGFIGLMARMRRRSRGRGEDHTAQPPSLCP
ncbi:MAG: PEP-CTERM sorting domain-containing protein [Nitrospira sp.]|nr:PEP-CTERM sorting domain-containing protein [Nitrospira sp.]